MIGHPVRCIGYRRGYTEGTLGRARELRGYQTLWVTWLSTANTFLISPREIDIREFIELRRFETMSLHHVLQEIKISKCKWLEPVPTDDKHEEQTNVARADEKPKKKHTNVTDSLKRREIFEELVFWYFNSFLLPLLSVGFLFSAAYGSKRIVVSPHSM